VKTYVIHVSCKEFVFKKNTKNSSRWVLVAHACNTSYSGGRDQEDCGLKPAGQIVRETYLKEPFTKIELVEWLKVSSSPSTTHTHTKEFLKPIKKKYRKRD
jgi:hypothetical protein